MDKLDGSDSVVLADEPVFYLSPGAPVTSLVLCLAAAVSTCYTYSTVIVMIFCQCAVNLPMKSAQFCYFSALYAVTCRQQISFHPHTFVSVFV